MNVWYEGSTASSAACELHQSLDASHYTLFCSALVQSHASTLDDPSVDISQGKGGKAGGKGGRKEG